MKPFVVSKKFHGRRQIQYQAEYAIQFLQSERLLYSHNFPESIALGSVANILLYNLVKNRSEIKGLRTFSRYQPLSYCKADGSFIQELEMKTRDELPGIAKLPPGQIHSALNLHTLRDLCHLTSVDIELELKKLFQLQVLGDDLLWENKYLLEVFVPGREPKSMQQLALLFDQYYQENQQFFREQPFAFANNNQNLLWKLLEAPCIYEQSFHGLHCFYIPQHSLLISLLCDLKFPVVFYLCLNLLMEMELLGEESQELVDKFSPAQLSEPSSAWTLDLESS